MRASSGLLFGASHLGMRTGIVLGVIQRISQLVQVPVGLVALATAKAPRGARKRRGPPRASKLAEPRRPSAEA